MTVAIYIRVSTEEQVREGFSISAQREKLKAFCRVHDWDDFKFYVDEGLSAKDTNRPQLELMLSHIEQGLINTVLVYRLDRLTRSVVDLYKLLDVFEKSNCTFKSATEVYDTGSAIGRLFITLVAAMAQWERENLGERVRMGQIEKARQGQWSAPAPFGYKKENNRLVKDEDQGNWYLKMVEKIKEGYSIRGLSDYMDNSPMPPKRGYKWHIRTLLDILQNPVYYGATKWLDEIVEDTHEPYLSKEEWAHLQKLLYNRQNFKKRDTSSIFIFQMKLICPNCGNRLTSERSMWKRKNEEQIQVSNRYRCQACALNKRKPFGVNEKKIEKILVDYMNAFTFEQLPKVTDENKDEHEKLYKELKQIEKQREKYQKAWSADWITDEEFTSRMNETKTLLADTKKKLERIKPSSNDDDDYDAETIKKIVTNMKRNWSKLTSEEKKQFLNMFIERIELDKNGIGIIISHVQFH
ncbi:recombinase family protein [Halalkalibacterium ligniniphilum]|uniref:recombinase family protein n=1 Tax=Halalkalibacterium ligniniphilum TaxID=1134413 RepID=UPI00034CFD0E|nr:recombinase family protein [Halalkalibacterium ligniniphilum]